MPIPATQLSSSEKMDPYLISKSLHTRFSHVWEVEQHAPLCCIHLFCLLTIPRFPLSSLSDRTHSILLHVYITWLCGFSALCLGCMLNAYHRTYYLTLWGLTCRTMPFISITNLCLRMFSLPVHQDSECTSLFVNAYLCKSREVLCFPFVFMAVSEMGSMRDPRWKMLSLTQTSNSL